MQKKNKPQRSNASLAVYGMRDDDGLRCVPRQFLIHHAAHTTSPQPSNQALLRGLEGKYNRLLVCVKIFIYAAMTLRHMNYLWS